MLCQRSVRSDSAQAGTLGPSIPLSTPQVVRLREIWIEYSSSRLADRKSLLGGLDLVKRNIDADGFLEVADHFSQQAFDVVTKGVGSAFDLSKEDPKTFDRYDTRLLLNAREQQRLGDMC
jgi:hypothetical protein